MPIYEFKCPVCSSPKPVKAAMHADFAAPMCDNCQVTCIRDFSAPGLIFKGEGWGGSK